MTRLSWSTQINDITDMAYIRQSRLSGHQSKPITLNMRFRKEETATRACDSVIQFRVDFFWFVSNAKHTWPAKSPQHAGTASTLNTAEPTTVPTPISLFVINVPTEFMNSSGLDVAAAMNVAPTTKSKEIAHWEFHAMSSNSKIAK